MQIKTCMGDRKDILRNKTVFLISITWFTRWKGHVNYDDDKSGPAPGPIFNHSLVQSSKDGNVLRKDITEGEEYTLLSPIAWRKLFQWYGGGPELEVFVINDEPDMEPITVKVWLRDGTWSYNEPVFRNIMVSRYITIKELKKHIGHKLSVPFYKYDL